MPAKPVNLLTRISGSFAAMQATTERDREFVPVKARSTPLTSSRNDADGVPTLAPVGFQTETVAQRPTHGGSCCLRDLSKARLNTVSPKAAGFVTSSWFQVAPPRTRSIWLSSDQAGNAASYPCEHGVIRKTAPTAISTACWSLSGRISAIAASSRFTSKATPTCRAIARSRRTRQVPLRCSIVSKQTARRPGLTTDAIPQGRAA